jgi:hypothetical protein
VIRREGDDGFDPPALPLSDSPHRVYVLDASAARWSAERLLIITTPPMGLDMYAIRRKYVKQWEHIKPENQYQVTVKKGGKPVPYIKPERISVIEEEVMYWRKANHIHQWFVDNVQDGNDDCGMYSVSREKLLELLNLCETIIASADCDDKAGDIPATAESNDGNAEASSRLALKDDTVARQLLPRQSGFFFGSQAYDEDYMFDIRETRDWLVRMFDEAKLDPWALDGISYHSSW